MSCNCCTDTLTLCEVPVCGNTYTDIVVRSPDLFNDETYYLHLFYQGVKMIIENLPIINADINIITFRVPAKKLSEDYCYEAYIADGDTAELSKQISFTVGSTLYNCLKIKTIPYTAILNPINNEF